MPDLQPTSTNDERLIYLVDDEAPMLDLAEISLLAGGYEVKKFQSPEAALESFARESRKPALLLTDFAMDVMNGLELSAKCKSVSPELKILMVSGTAGPEIMLESPGTVDRFIPKPYQPSELAGAVRSILDS